jgi:hypothetical protein
MQLFKSCINCEKRHPGCHGKCKDYLDNRAELDAINSLKRYERDTDSYVIEHVYKNEKQTRRNKRR